MTALVRVCKLRGVRASLAGVALALGLVGGFEREARAVDAAPQGSALDQAEKPVPPEVALRAASIARQTMSPFCPGRTLADCPSNYATEWREDIRAMVVRGMTSEQIQAELSQRAGGDLSGIPHRDVSYALPLGLGAAALLVLVLLFRRLRRGRPDTEPEKAAPEAAELASPRLAVDDERLRAELDAEEDEDAR